MKKVDLVIIGIAISLAAILGGYSYHRISSKPVEKYAHIYVDNKLYKTVPLNGKNSNQTIEIKNKYGWNSIQIEKGIVKMVDGDCHDKICAKSETISELEQSIVCFPHRLIVIIKDNPSGKLDSVSN